MDSALEIFLLVVLSGLVVAVGFLLHRNSRKRVDGAADELTVEKPTGFISVQQHLDELDRERREHREDLAATSEWSQGRIRELERAMQVERDAHADTRETLMSHLYALINAAHAGDGKLPELTVPQPPPESDEQEFDAEQKARGGNGRVLDEDEIELPGEDEREGRVQTAVEHALGHGEEDDEDA